MNLEKQIKVRLASYKVLQQIHKLSMAKCERVKAELVESEERIRLNELELQKFELIYETRQ